jgi:hypothetical protein
MLTDRPGTVTVCNRDSNADGGTVTLVLTVWHRDSSADGPVTACHRDSNPGPQGLTLCHSDSKLSAGL